MGGGSSSPFQAIPAERELPRTLSTSDVGRVAHLVGTVTAADGKVLSSPFGGMCGVAIRITASRQSGLSSTSSHGSFRAQTALPFYLADGGVKIRVLVPDVEAWGWRLATTHTAFNIMRDEEGMLWSGGDRPHQHSAIEARPDGAIFWERLNGGRDPLNMLQLIPASRTDGGEWTDSGALRAVGGAYNAEDLQKPRMAVERTLQLGERVAIIGVLGATEDGEITISPQMPKGKGTITNDASFAKSSLGPGAGAAAPPPPDAPDVELRVVPMGKHKKAKTFAGKRW
jgi:hypothetical protein